MKSRNRNDLSIAYSIFVLLVFVSGPAHAELLCIKKKQRVKQNRVITKNIVRKVDDVCPKGYLDLSVVNEFDASSLAISASQIAGSISGSKILNSSISNEKLTDNAVTTSKIANASITREKLASDLNVPGLPGKVVFGGADFNLAFATTQCFLESEGTWRLSSPPGTCCLHAPVRIPNASTITQLDASVIDNDGSIPNIIEIDLREKSLFDASDSQQIATVETGADNTEAQLLTTSDINHVVDYGSFSYFLYVCFNDVAHQIISAQLYFE